jgi:hypothetical protein
MKIDESQGGNNQQVSVIAARTTRTIVKRSRKGMRNQVQSTQIIILDQAFSQQTYLLRVCGSGGESTRTDSVRATKAANAIVLDDGGSNSNNNSEQQSRARAVKRPRLERL